MGLTEESGACYRCIRKPGHVIQADDVAARAFLWVTGCDPLNEDGEVLLCDVCYGIVTSAAAKIEGRERHHR